MSNPVSEMIESAMQNMRSMIDVNSVVGQPIKPDANTMIIPIAKVSYGFGGGGSDMVAKHGEATKYSDKGKDFAGAIGGGTSIKAEAFLVISGGNVRIVPVSDSASTADKIVDMVPGMIDKISGFFNKGGKNNGAGNDYTER